MGAVELRSRVIYGDADATVNFRLDRAT